MDKLVIKNACCKYLEGQSGLCLVKEFTHCNPIKCGLYTIDELSTIKDLQEQLNKKEQELNYWKHQAELGSYTTDRLAKQLEEKTQECEELREQINSAEKHIKDLGNIIHEMEEDTIITDRYKQVLDGIEEITQTALNMTDYKTYFKRDNKSLKQEGFKSLKKILEIINEVKQDD